MTRIEFLERIFDFFGKDIEKNAQLLKDYDLALSTPKRIDWDKLYNKTIKESETKYLPMPKWFIAKFDECIKVDEQTYKINGGTGVLKLAYKDKNTGEITKRLTYEYDMSNCPYSLAEIKAKFRAKFKGAYEDFVYYPDYYKIVGNTIIDTREYENAC